MQKEEESIYKTTIHKNDLKFISRIDIKNNVIESDIYEKHECKNEIIFDCEETENLYNVYKNKNKIDLRLKLSKDEKYEFLDLSSLKITNKSLKKLFSLDIIKNILQKIYYLDLSDNRLEIIPDLHKYENIKVLNVSYNNIQGHINNNNYVELVCKNNKINSITSSSLEVIDASQNEITYINTKNVTYLCISNNQLSEIENYKNLEYLECAYNKISILSGFECLKELYVSNNILYTLDDMENLEVLNCIGNPIDKINYFPKMSMMIISTHNISKKFKIINAKKVENDYFIRTN
jgi:hypothetical protein